MLKHLGRWIYDNKFKSIFLWLIILVIIIGSVAGLGTHYSSNLSVSGIPSTEIQGTLKKEFHQNPSDGTMNVVIHSKHHHGIITDKVKHEVSHSIRKVKQSHSNQIKSINNPYTSQLVSKDKTTAYVPITFNKNSQSVTQSTIHSIEHEFHNVKQHTSKVAYSGSVQISPIQGGELPEVIGMIIAFILLLVLFHSFVAAGLPIISAFVGLVSGLIIVGLGTNIFSLVNFAQTLTAMLALAVGIDYALFILNRYKTDLKDLHGDRKSALGNALSEAGKSVLFAGSTVIIAVCGLSIFKISFLTQMGLCSAVGVLFALFSALTLLPALIAWGQNHIKPNKRDTKTMVKHPNGFSRLLTNHPISSAVVALIVLVLFALPARNMRLGMPYDGSLPIHNTSRQAYDLMSNKFGEGTNAPLLNVVKLDTNHSKSQNHQEVKHIVHHINDLKGTKMMVPSLNKKKAQKIENQVVTQARTKLSSPRAKQAMAAKLTPIVKTEMAKQLQKHPQLASNPQSQQQIGNQIKAKVMQKFKYQQKEKLVAQIKAAVKQKAMTNAQISKDGKYAMMTVIPYKGSESVKTAHLASQIRHYSNYTKRHYHAKMILTGSNAINMDIVNKLNNAIPTFAVIIIVIAFVLLMFAFKSILIPFIAMLGFALSLLASFGITTVVMQEGFMKGIFGISKGAPIIAFLPVIVIGLLFGLAMDYEVFMVSRAREEYQKNHNNTRSILIAIQDSGPVVITAALIMMAVFGSFAINSNPTVKSMGLSLAFGVFCDAFLVRLIIVPSMIKLFGKANWWLPGHNHHSNQ